MHSLLLRQLKKNALSVESRPDSKEDWKKFLDAVSSEYFEKDEDLELLERSLDLTSKEMQDRYEKMKEFSIQLEFKKKALLKVEKISGIGVILIKQNDENWFNWSKEVFSILHIDFSLPPTNEHFLQHIHPDDREKLASWRSDLIRDDQIDLQFRVIDSDQNIRFCLLMCNKGDQILSEGSKVYQIVILDITEQKKVESLRIERDTAKSADLAKSVFLANMSHEIRTPMHGILSYAHFGLQKIDNAPQEKIKTYFREIYESASHLMNLLNDILDLSKLESNKTSYDMHSNDLIRVVKNGISQLECFANEKKIQIHLKHEEDEITSVFDSSKIQRVATNIISNAIKYSMTDSSIEIQLMKDSDFIICKVYNQGVGIPKEELELVFDKFYQSSKTRTGAGGTGLGLSICREIINHHEGKIWAENEENGCTCFTFKLPRKMEPQP